MAGPDPDGIAGLRRLFLSQLSRTADADPQLVQAFPIFTRAAQHPKLRRFCEEGLSYSRNRLDRLGQVFALIDAMMRFKRNAAMKQLVSQAKTVLQHTASPLRDAALITVIQLLSHHGRAEYSVLQQVASALGETAARRVLDKSFREKDDATREMNGLLRIDLLPRARRSTSLH